MAAWEHCSEGNARLWWILKGDGRRRAHFWKWLTSMMLGENVGPRVRRWTELFFEI